MKPSRPESKRHELIQFVVDHAEDALKKIGIDDDAACRIATNLADGLADQFGGQVINFPVEYRRKLAQRDAAVLARFNGTNVAELARELCMTEGGMRKLLRRANARA